MGRKKKGVRKAVCVKLPITLIDAGKAHAEANGIDFTALVTQLLAAATGETYDLQEELPLAESA
jgi:hypothetical protein